MKNWILALLLALCATVAVATPGTLDAAAATGAIPCSASAATSVRTRNGVPPVASRPASSLAKTDFARATTAGGRPASLATAIP